MWTVRKLIWLLLAALGMAGALVVLGPSAAAPAADGTRVLMVDNEPDLTNWHFDPAEVTVPAGATVVWENKGKEDHTVTADDKSFDSGTKRTGGTFERAFPKPGRYTYHCAPHPWMTGAVRVVATATAAAAANAPAAGTERTAAGAPVSTTAAPTPTTFPPSLAAPASRAAAETTTSAPGETTTSAPATDEASAAPAASRKGSGGGLAWTIALVLLPTLAGLAIGAKLRQSTRHHKTEPA
jgi:plastocyanin